MTGPQTSLTVIIIPVLAGPGNDCGIRVVGQVISTSPSKTICEVDEARLGGSGLRTGSIALSAPGQKKREKSQEKNPTLFSKDSTSRPSDWHSVALTGTLLGTVFGHEICLSQNMYQAFTCYLINLFKPFKASSVDWT